jgi:exonuclease VII large subunit
MRKRIDYTNITYVNKETYVKQIIKQLSLLLGSVSAVAILSVAPAWAAHGPSAAAETTSSSTSSSTTTTENETEETDAHVGQLHKQAAELLHAKRQTAKEHTVAQKQQACTAHQAEIDKRSKNYAAAAQRHLDVFNKIFTRVQDFQSSKKLSVADYDTLVATAKDKQAAAQTAVDALKALDVKLDCTQPDPASSVATLKTAVASSRTALQDYRKSIKDVIVALKGASTSQSGDDTSSSDTNTSNTTTTGGDQ